MKLTPLNIVLACFLAWTITEWGADQLTMSWWALGLFVLAITASDLLFRLILKDVKKLWAAEIGFMLVASILMIVIKTVLK